jgi:hypothetical protein
MKNKNKEALIMIICGVIMVVTLVILISIKPENKQVSSNNTVESLSNTVDLDGFDESDLIIENLPFIRLNYYDEETNERYGTMITFDGSIYKYSFNEITVNYPDSDRFIVNQTLYFDNLIDEVGTISNEDLESLRYYSENIKYEYDTEEPVFDTIGNSISITNYADESNIVLVNSDGIKNTNENTDTILDILSKYNISL